MPNMPLAEVLESLRDPTVTSLTASYSGYGDAGIAMIAAALPASSVTALYLDCTHTSDIGAKILADVLPKTKVVTLGLHSNHIGHDGAEAFAQSILGSSVTSLNLNLNPVKSGPAAKSCGRAARANSKRTVELSEMLDAGSFSIEHWADLQRLAPAVAEKLKYTATDKENVPSLFLAAADVAHAAGQDVTDFVVHAVPLELSLPWLKQKGVELSAKDFLSPDGTIPQDRVVCMGGVKALFANTDIWENKAQAKKAFQSLPETQQRHVDTIHQLNAYLGRQERAQAMFSGRER